MSSRPGPGSASHLAVTRHHSNGGIDGGRGQLRQGERAVDGPGRGRCRDPAGRAHRRGARTRGLRRRARRHRADRTCARANGVPRAGRYRGIPVRPAEVEGRRGKQPDGSAKTREVKLVTVWTAEGRDKQGRPLRDPRVGQLQRRGRERGQPRHRPAAGRLRATRPSRGSTARLRHRGPPGRRGRRRPLDLEPVGRAVSGAIEIVDIYHAKQHLCDVAKAIYGAGTDLAEQWAKDRHGELDAGRLGALVTALRTQTETTPEARKCIHYVFGNRHRMRYPQFRARGLCISSGVVEAGCKQTQRTAQARRYALDHRWRQRHHRPALLPAQRPLRGLLGAASRKRRLKRHLTNLSCTPGVGRCTASCGAAAGGCATPHVGSSRASAAPPLRSGPAGDPNVRRGGMAGYGRKQSFRP